MGLCNYLRNGKWNEAGFNQPFSMAQHIFENRSSILWYISFTGRTAAPPDRFSA
jgi:hypothetical protein